MGASPITNSSKANGVFALSTGVFSSKGCEAWKHKGCSTWQSAHLFESFALYAVFSGRLSAGCCLTLCCSLMVPWGNLASAKGRCPPCPCWCVSAMQCHKKQQTNKRVFLSVIWSCGCASSSMAPLSSSGSSRRMPGNTPAVRATASVSRPQHQPTWLFSVSVTVATKWRGRGGETSSLSGRRQHPYGGCCSFWQHCPFSWLEWGETL